MANKKGWRKGGRRFIRLWMNVKCSQAYYDLSVYARCALFELLERYSGINNGMIGLGCRELAEAIKCAQATAYKALRELDDAGLARPTTMGFWRGKRATEWRLTFFPCNKTGELPVLNWTARSVRVEKRKVRVEKRKAVLSSPGSTQEPKNSIKQKALSSPGSTHIDIPSGPDLITHDTAAQVQSPPTIDVKAEVARAREFMEQRANGTLRKK
jgi:hypothetical protein